SKVVILGLNGAGKTTLLRMLAGVDKPDTGDVIAGHGLKVGYYAQEHETLDVDRTVLENMRSSAPDMKDAEVRGILGSFLFSGDDVDKPAGVLSGGEKTRLALATIVASSANVLLL
ncbi:ABC transporter, partial [Massilia sp. JS1662]